MANEYEKAFQFHWQLKNAKLKNNEVKFSPIKMAFKHKRTYC